MTDLYPLSPTAAKLRRRMLHPVLFRIYCLGKLPLGLLAGLRLRELSAERCVTTVPFGWRTTNPFRSTYFAALSMAAELSTGAPALLAAKSAPASVSTLIVGMEARFEKKATMTVAFTCADVPAIRDAVESAVATGEPATLRAETVGRMPDGTVVARFVFDWSFRARA